MKLNIYQLERAKQRNSIKKEKLKEKLIFNVRK